MKILVDTNILVSALLFPRSKPAKALLYTAYHTEKIIRDTKDQPILDAAIFANVDIILTGDKDFLSLDMEHPKCMTVAQFLETLGTD